MLIRYLTDKIRKKRFIKSQKLLFYEKGSLFNSFLTTRTIFIHIPKTAGLSLINSVYGDVNGGSHRTFSFYKEILGKNLDAYFTFSFVRDPVERLYSAYSFLQQGGVNVYDKNLFNNFLTNYKDFEDFVINGLDKELINKIVHFIPQTNFICDFQGNIMVDFVGKYENINIDIERLSTKLGIEIVLPSINVNKEKNFNICFDQDIIDKIKLIYKKDFDILGY